jgi:N-acetylneuraminic acid mutarotase
VAASPYRRWLCAALVVAVFLATAAAWAASSGDWAREQRLPLARAEVAGALYKGKIAVAGGFLGDGSNSARVELYDPARDRWTRLPNLPLAVNHPMAAAGGGRLYVLGGYANRMPQRAVFAFDGERWRRLPPLPEARAAGGAAFAGGKLYVVGGVRPGRTIAEEAFVYDPKTNGWSTIPGPTPREHLGVAALGGRVYAVAGRTRGFDTNLDVFEVYRPSEGRWMSLSPVPDPRGGTGLAALPGRLVSVGGEEEGGTIASVYVYDVAGGSWSRVQDLPTPRHGLAVVGRSDTVYAIAGGTVPGLSVSRVNEALTLP